MALYRYKTNGNGFASVVAWLALLIPMWAVKAAAHHVAAEKERKRKKEYYDEARESNNQKSERRRELSSYEKCLAVANPIVPIGTIHLICPRCGSQNYDWKTGMKYIFSNIGSEHFCSIECYDAWEKLDEHERDLLRGRAHDLRRKCIISGS